jgi:hypothetical protein
VSIIDRPADHEAEIAVMVLDIAEGGVLLRSDEPIDRDVALQLTFSLPITEAELELELVTSDDPRSEPSGSGLFLAHCRFTTLPLDALWSIVGYCMATNGNLAEANEVLRLREERHSPALVELHGGFKTE